MGTEGQAPRHKAMGRWIGAAAAGVSRHPLPGRPARAIGGALKAIRAWWAEQREEHRRYNEGWKELGAGWRRADARRRGVGWDL